MAILEADGRLEDIVLGVYRRVEGRVRRPVGLSIGLCIRFSIGLCIRFSARVGTVSLWRVVSARGEKGEKDRTKRDLESGFPIFDAHGAGL
jgi:hypothetical protein